MIEYLIIYFTIYRRFKKIYVVLAEEEIIYNNARGEIRIPYENIKALKFPSIKYMGGWIKIIHNKGNIRLTVTLQSIGDMVKGLKNKLDEKNISNVYNEKAIYNFIKTGEYSDQSWERVYENLKVFVIAISLSVGATVIASIFITEIIVKIFVFAGSLVGPLLAFIISEIVFARELAKGASKENFYVPDRDKRFELKIYKWTFGIYLFVFLMVLIIMIVKGM